MRTSGEPSRAGCRLAEAGAGAEIAAGRVTSSAGFLFASRLACGMKAAVKALPGGNVEGDSRAELARLMRRVAAQDSTAFKALYERTSSKLYGIALRLLRDEAEAQDVLQEVYLLVWRKGASYDPGRAAVITWLATLARNKSIDRLRSRKAPAAELEAAAEIADDCPSSLDILERAEDGSRLRHCLEELEERARTSIRLAFFDGVTYSDLAEQAAVPLPTMKSWIRRGLQRLRECLER